MSRRAHMRHAQLCAGAAGGGGGGGHAHGIPQPSTVFTGWKNNWAEQTGSRGNRWIYLTFMHDCTRARECESVRFCSYDFIAYLVCLCIVDVHHTCTTPSFSAGNCKSRSIEEVNLQKIHLKSTSVETCLFRDALYDNIKAFCCFSKDSRLVIFFSILCKATKCFGIGE